MPEMTTEAQAPVVPMEDRIAAMMMGEPKPTAEPQKPTAKAEAPTQAATETQELTVEDLETPAETSARILEELEVVHNGAPVKLNREQAKDFAEKGYDYTRKAEALANERRQLQSVAQAVQAQTQIHPQMMEAMGDLRAFQRALKGYEGVNWLAKSQEDPIGYTQEFARYQQLQQGLREAETKAQQTYGQLQAAMKQAFVESLKVEHQRAVNAVPAWKDPQKFQKDREAMQGYLGQLGFTDAEINSVGDHRFLVMARDAAAYRALVAQKQAASKKVADLSPVAKPGSTQTRGERAAEETADIKRRIRASTDEREKEKLLTQVFAKKL